MTKKDITKALSAICAITFVLFYSSCKKTKAPDAETPSLVKNYTKARVTNVSIINLPFINSAGFPWDSLDGPDVVFSISEGKGFYVNSSSSSIMKNIAPSDLPLSGPMPFSHYYKVSEDWVGRLYERDSLSYSSDTIGEFHFKPEDYKPVWPSKILFQHPTISNLKIELTMDWIE
jgi:hypothetical protein